MVGVVAAALRLVPVAARTAEDAAAPADPTIELAADAKTAAAEEAAAAEEMEGADAAAESAADRAAAGDDDAAATDDAAAVVGVGAPALEVADPEFPEHTPLATPNAPGRI